MFAVGEADVILAIPFEIKASSRAIALPVVVNGLAAIASRVC